MRESSQNEWIPRIVWTFYTCPIFYSYIIFIICFHIKYILVAFSWKYATFVSTCVLCVFMHIFIAIFNLGGIRWSEFRYLNSNLWEMAADQGVRDLTLGTMVYSWLTTSVPNRVLGQQ